MSDSDRGLFADALERIDSVVDMDPVKVPHSSAACFAVDGRRRRWVRKRMAFTGFQPILAEALAYLIGRELGVRGPAGAVCGDGDDLSWLSGFIPDALHWQPRYAHLIRNTGEMGAMLALDALVLNEDRHAGNILVTPLAGELNVVTWAIDAGEALVGHPRDFSEAGLRVSSPGNLARGLPLSLLEEGAMEAAGQAAKFSGLAKLRFWVEDACQIVAEKEVDLLHAALSRRMEAAEDLVRRYLQDLEGLP